MPCLRTPPSVQPGIPSGCSSAMRGSALPAVHVGPPSGARGSGGNRVDWDGLTLLAVGVGAGLALPRRERRGGGALVLLVLVLLRLLLFLVASHLTLGHGEPPCIEPRKSPLGLTRESIRFATNSCE